MISIGELAKRTGVKIPTIRYYEQMGLISAPGRSDGNQRRYDTHGLDRLIFIRHARDLGLSIQAIRNLISMGEEGGSCARAHQVAAEHLVHIRQRIARLQRLETELTRIADLPDGGNVDECSVLAAFSDHDSRMTEH